MSRLHGAPGRANEFGFLDLFVICDLLFEIFAQREKNRFKTLNAFALGTESMMHPSPACLIEVVF